MLRVKYYTFNVSDANLREIFRISEKMSKNNNQGTDFLLIVNPLTPQASHVGVHVLYVLILFETLYNLVDEPKSLHRRARYSVTDASVRSTNTNEEMKQEQ